MSSADTSNHCFVDGRLFADAGGDPGVIRHKHHVIPRAFGGLNGPTVMVCTGHHSLLHLIGSRLIHNKPFFELLTHDPKQDQKLLWLASRIQIAEAASRGDPNKKSVIPLVLDAPTQAKLVKLAKAHGVSRGKLVHLLIAQEYGKIFCE